MFNDITLIDLAKEKRKIYEQRGALMRLARQAEGKPSFGCLLCMKLGALLLKAGNMLRAIARAQSADDQPDTEVIWQTMFDNHQKDSYVI